jgi:hypothetical protein
MNRLLTAGTTALLAGTALTGLAVVPALADTPTTITVAWTVTSGDFGNRWATPQKLYTGDPTGCGVGLLQVDVYRYDDVVIPGTHETHRQWVDALVATGELDSASQDSPVWISNTDVTLTACTTATSSPTAPATTAPATPTATASPTATVTPSPTATAPATSSPTASSGPTTGRGGASPAGGAEHPLAASHAETPHLAFTGSFDSGPALGLAALLLTAGGVLIAVARRRKARA